MDDGDYLGAYKRFFIEFVERMNVDDQLPVKMSGHEISGEEVTGEVIDMTLQYLNQKYVTFFYDRHAFTFKNTIFLFPNKNGEVFIDRNFVLIYR